MKFDKVYTEVDSKILIKAIKKEIQIPWNDGDYLLSSRIYMAFVERFPNYMMNHIYKEGNMAVDGW